MKLVRFLRLLLAAVAFTPSLAISARAQVVTNLANFTSTTPAPVGALIQATDGNYYGANSGGGAHYSGDVFRVTPTGEITAIYSFCSQPNCADGTDPIWGPVLGSDGNLYGLTESGGSYAGSTSGSGTFYKLTLGGELTTLYTFCSATPCTDGQFPNGIVLGQNGNFYGTAYTGGQFNQGDVFEITPTGKLTVLHSFCSLAHCADGYNPIYPPIQGSNGNIYGTTLYDGQNSSGVLYELTSSGDYQVLHNFCYSSPCEGGGQPNMITAGANGNVFGTALYGGTLGNGTAFAITSTNQYRVIANFDYLRGGPSAGMAQASDGNLYGTTVGPGSGQSGGTIFEVTPEGRYTDFYMFGECSVNGYRPDTTLLQGTDGILYGTTSYGGNGTNGDGCAGYGTMFSLSNGLNPLVETVPTGGSVGQSVIVLGNNLTGSTSVTFHGVEAKFTVESDTYIKATVPAGATTGVVSVVTPSGTLNSNPQFVVTK
jgi:uncharacterized repeat protein (TIGR03803 family)